MIYLCCDKRRRSKLLAENARRAALAPPFPLINGIDFLEVLDRDAPAYIPRQRTLLVRLLEPPAATPDVRQLLITGGDRIRPVRVLWAAMANAVPAVTGATQAEIDFYAGLDTPQRLLVVRTDSTGDHSTYALRVVRHAGTDDRPAEGFDPVMSAVDFSFKVECPSDFDCAPEPRCPPDRPSPPVIDYLAKDYASLRRLMLDRMALLAPQWQARHAADVGVTLVEMLAHVADRLSYRQDAVATEAYLDTARRRVSVRRHARLVDYRMHDGCNARAWVSFTCASPMVPLAAGTRLLTRLPGYDSRIPSGRLPDALRVGPTVFETLHAARLFQDHSQMNFYAWGDDRCCLPAGATRATLAGHYPNLLAGDVLILVEKRSPRTGVESDADPSRRHAVRLTGVQSFAAPGVPLADVLSDPPQPVTDIIWSVDDALPFPVCVSSVTDPDHGSRPVPAVSVALGNIVLADHGLTPDRPQRLAPVPGPRLSYADRSGDRCIGDKAASVPIRFNPQLVGGRPLTFSAWKPPAVLARFANHPAFEADLQQSIVPDAVGVWLAARGTPLVKPISIQGSSGRWSVNDGRTGYVLVADSADWQLYALGEPARSGARQSPQEATPRVVLTDDAGHAWLPRAHLLGSDADDAAFVVETENDGAARLRFGDDQHGRRPERGTVFDVAYRVGNGPAGNVGADVIVHAVSDDNGITGVRNPLPAGGGVEPETVEQVRQRAPYAFRTQQRAVTAADYAAMTERDDPRVQRAAATFRWTGSWHTMFVTVDRSGGLDVDAAFQRDVREKLEPYRMAGHDLHVDTPRFVPLEITLHVCVKPAYFRSDVEQALREVFTHGLRRDRRPGVLHPDRFTFGQPVYLSPIYAAAQAVPGVASAEVTLFRRQGDPLSNGLASGRIDLDRLEIARLDNDPDYPDRGVFRFVMGGGK